MEKRDSVSLSGFRNYKPREMAKLGKRMREGWCALLLPCKEFQRHTHLRIKSLLMGKVFKQREERIFFTSLAVTFSSSGAAEIFQSADDSHLFDISPPNLNGASPPLSNYCSSRTRQRRRQSPFH